MRPAQILIPWSRGGGWERLLSLVQERGVPLGIVFLDGTNMSANQKAAGAAKRMAHPVRKWLRMDCLSSLHKRIRPLGAALGQDGGPRVLALIKESASSAILAERLPRHRSPMARPDFVADRRACADSERFEPLMERICKEVEEGARKPQAFRQERVELGEFFVLKGQLVYIADLRDEHRRNGKPDARLRVIFDNGTESNLLMSSLVRRLYEDKDARRIGTTDVGPLFEGARTGFVYVLRSRSDKPEARGLLKVGTTSGTVEDRIARAETQSTFLFAPVEILETYELKGHSAKEAEQRIHRALRSYLVALRVTGPDGRTFSATDWFKATPGLVEEAIDLALK